MAKNFEQLTKDLQSDAALMKEFQDAKLSYDDVDGIIAFAAKKGYTVTAEDIKNFKDKMKNGEELSEDDLEKVAGGDMVDQIESVINCYMYIAVSEWA